jgi:VRR-NUC domain
MNGTMRAVLEKDIQRHCLEWLAYEGIFCWRQNNLATPRGDGVYSFHGKRGVSDILGIMPDGRFLAIEVKQPGKKLRPEQEEFLQEITERGGVGMCVHSLDELQADFKELSGDPAA